MLQVPIQIFFRRLLLSFLMIIFFLFPLTNLAVHEIFLSGRFGNQWEFWLHGFTSLFIYFFYCHYLLTTYKQEFSFKSALGLGLLWGGLFFVFFLVMAVHVFNVSWSVVLKNFNVLNHELLPIVLLLIVLSPSLIWKKKL